MLVQVDTTNGQAAACRPLGVTRNNAYLLLLDAKGNEIDRLMFKGGMRRDDEVDVDRVVTAMKAALAAPRGTPRIERLIEMMDDTDPNVRRDAAEMLGLIGPEAKKAVPGLVALLDDQTGNPSVAWAAVYALRRLGPVAADALPTLTRLVEDGERPVNERQAALMALGKIDPEGKVSLPTLEAALAGGPYVVIGAAIAAKDLGRAAAPLVPALRAALRKGTNEVARAYIADALAAVDPDD